MFEFMRDLLYDIGGIDTTAAKLMRDEKREEKKLSRHIFSKKAKALIITMGILYLIISITMIAIAWNAGNGITTILINGTLSLIDLAVCVCLIFGTKKTEVAALIGGIAFIIFLYLSVLVNKA